MDIDSYESPDAQDLLRVGLNRLSRSDQDRRELLVNALGASSFVVAATLIAVLADWQTPLSAVTLVLVLGVSVAGDAVKLPVAHGWARPAMFAFVPALFILPTPLVPLVSCAAILLSTIPKLARREISPKLLPVYVSDAWFAIGPVLVIVLADAQKFDWSNWPIYLAALVAQMVFDMSAGLTMSWFAEGIPPRSHLSLLAWTYLIDATIAPIGLVIAASAVQHSGLVLIALCPILTFQLFARERKQRLEGTLALSTAYRGTALLLGDIVEADHHYTGMHSREVVDLSVGVAEALGVDATQRRNVEFAALLHDVGKIRVPKEIINKPGKLNDEEWRILRQHTIDGEKMLKQVGGILSGVGRLVRSSHERYDGLGYPDGLVGEEIPIESRIVSACDAFSAMTTDRPYRPALALEAAVKELHRCAGTQFDPVVVKPLIALVGRRVAPARDFSAVS